MPNRQTDIGIGYTSNSDQKYDVFSFDETHQKRSKDESFQNLLQVSKYIEKNDNNLEHLYPIKLPENMYNEIQSSMSDWEEYMHCKEHEILTKSISINYEMPAIRSCDRVIQYPERNNVNNNSFSCSKVEIRSHDDTWNEEMSEEQKSNKKIYAEAEKARGNKEYKANNFIKACEHYSNSIAAGSLKDAYNNRAQANIKLKNYSSALPDLDEVLRREPMNTKALMRRAVCKSKILMYQEALSDIQTVLNLYPKDKEAVSLRTEVEKYIAELKGRRFRIRLVRNCKHTFEVVASQLPVYAKFDGNYVIEVDKSGCAKKCVCDFCSSEDQRTRFRPSGLHIRERCRWRRLTCSLIDELHLDVGATPAAPVSSSCSPDSTGPAGGASASVSAKKRRSAETSTTLQPSNAAAAVNGGAQRTTSPHKSVYEQPQAKNLANVACSLSQQAADGDKPTSTRVRKCALYAAPPRRPSSSLVPSPPPLPPPAPPSRPPSRRTSFTDQIKNEYSKLVDVTRPPSSPDESAVERVFAPQHPPSPASPAKSTSITNGGVAPPTIVASQTKSMKNATNMNHQRAEYIENALQNMRLAKQDQQNGNISDFVNDFPPGLLKEKFDSRIDAQSLQKLIRSVCENFEAEKDWPLMSEYLDKISHLERFRIVITFIDEETKCELSSIFNRAIDLELDNAAKLKTRYLVH